MGALRFDPSQIETGGAAVATSMITFLFRCPTTGLTVQGWAPEGSEQSRDDAYESVMCTACARLHLVNPQTKRVLGADED